MLWWVRIHPFCPLKIIFSKVVSIQKSLRNRNPTFSGFIDSRSQVEDCWGAKGFDFWWVRIHPFCPLMIIFSKVVSIQKSLRSQNPTYIFRFYRL
jgi:hypothetical protein